jgi:hypothetical protein
MLLTLLKAFQHLPLMNQISGLMIIPMLSAETVIINFETFDLYLGQVPSTLTYAI